MIECLIVSIKYGVSRPWSFLRYSGQLLNSPPIHLRSVLILGRVSALCRKELAIHVPLLWRAWKKEIKTWQVHFLS